MIQDRLLNWGRYWRDGGMHFSHCCSIEYRYVPGKEEAALFEAEAQQERKRPAPDWRDAEIVNHAWKCCHPKTKRLLKWLFCMGSPSIEKVCARCSIRLEPKFIFEKARYGAIKEIERILDEPDFLRKISANSSSSSLSPPVNSATTAPSAVRSTEKEVEEVD